jgi:hypothetical protein
VLMPSVNAVKGPDGQNGVFVQVDLGQIVNDMHGVS